MGSQRITRFVLAVLCASVFVIGAGRADADVITIGSLGTLTNIDDADPSAGVLDFFFVNFTPFDWASQMDVASASGTESFSFTVAADGVPSPAPRQFSVLEQLTSATFTAAVPSLAFLLDGSWWQIDSPATAFLSIGPFLSSGDFYSAEITANAFQVPGPAPVPEPSTLILLASSAAAACGRRLYRRVRPA